MPRLVRTASEEYELASFRVCWHPLILQVSFLPIQIPLTIKWLMAQALEWNSPAPVTLDKLLFSQIPRTSIPPL